MTVAAPNSGQAPFKHPAICLGPARIVLVVTEAIRGKTGLPAKLMPGTTSRNVNPGHGTKRHRFSERGVPAKALRR
jgi:hypothetical protein